MFIGFDELIYLRPRTGAMRSPGLPTRQVRRLTAEAEVSGGHQLTAEPALAGPPPGRLGSGEDGGHHDLVGEPGAHLGPSPHLLRSISTAPVTRTWFGPASVTVTGTSSGRPSPCTVSVPITMTWLPVAGRAPVAV
jgi:hypothetical protein